MPNPISGENREAKLGSIVSYFQDLEEKIEFLFELSKSGRSDEARILCSCYIDHLASLLYGSEKGNKFVFVQALKEFGGEEVFSCIHPRMLEQEISKKKSREWTRIQKKIFPVLQEAPIRLYSEEEMMTLFSPLVDRDELNKIKEEFWRGTYAAIVYSEMRVPSVHGPGPMDVSFATTTFRGQPVPTIDFQLLHTSLKRIAAIAREKTISTEKWFGRDQ